MFYIAAANKYFKHYLEFFCKCGISRQKPFAVGICVLWLSELADHNYLSSRFNLA